MPKKPLATVQPPPSSSSEEEDEEQEEDQEEEQESSSEESSGEEDTERLEIHPSSDQLSQSQSRKIIQTNPTHATEQSSTDSDGSESGSGSETDSERVTNVPQSKVKPIASKTGMEVNAKDKISMVKNSPIKETPVKRHAEKEIDRDAKDTKRAKKDKEPDKILDKEEDGKKLPFQRLWSDEDELALLQGLIDFLVKRGHDPLKDMNSFHEFIKKSLHFDVSLTQLKDKVFRLKKKYENNVKRVSRSDDKALNKPHDQHTFELSKSVWGGGGTSVGGGSGVGSGSAGVGCDGAGDLSVKSNQKVKKRGSDNNNEITNLKELTPVKADLVNNFVDDTHHNIERTECEKDKSITMKDALIDRSTSIGGMEDFVLTKGMDLLDRAKRFEMEEKWKKLHVAEMESFLKRIELIREQTMLVLAAYKEHKH